MSTLEEIREAIAKLSPEEYCELMAELHPFEDDAWDVQMKADLAAGKLDHLNARADAAYKAGLCIPLEQILEEP